MQLFSFSPFAGFENAILTFQVPAGAPTVNAVGNRQLPTQPLIIKCLLKQPTSPTTVSTYAPEIQQYAGMDGFAELLEGYLVDPTTYPVDVNILQEADAQVAFSLGKVELGRFKLIPVIQSPYVVAVGIDFITPIRGIFRRN